VRDLFGSAARTQSDWCIVWVAGSGVIGTAADHLNEEIDQFRAILDVVALESARSGNASRGAVFFSSSAGGVYGGSSSPPYTEATEPVPLSPYGETKLRMEKIISDFSIDSGVSVLVGRVANVYGPGQKLDKMQGLISHMAKAQFSPSPANIFVPLDTVRDYIYVADCAELICDSIDRLSEVSAHQAKPVQATKILASGQAVTVGSLIGHFRSLARGNPHIMLGSSPTISMQALDLRLKSIVWPDLDHRSLTPLPSGIHATMLDIVRGIQAG
jgi:UDP-glucose 4-epimerase